jgi:hypothetical protein
VRTTFAAAFLIYVQRSEVDIIEKPFRRIKSFSQI